MNAKLICILITAMFLINANAYNENKFSERNEEGIPLLNIIVRVLPELYEKMFQNDDVKIYGGRSYAQGFYPYFENLTKIELPISVVKTFGKRLCMCKSNPWKLGDLIVRICENESGMPGKVLLERRFSYEEVLGANGLITWELEKQITLVRGVDDPYWQEHGLEPRNEEYGSKLYFIVVTADGGFDNVLASLYYTWDLGESEDDEAKTGVAYFRYNENSMWRDIELTLGFNIDGCLAYEEPDGEENYHGFFIIPIGFKSWTETFASLFRGEHIVHADSTPGYYYDLDFIYSTLESIDIKSDGDDVIIFYLCGAGGICEICGVTADELAKRFNRMGAKGMCMIFSACHSGSFVTLPCSSSLRKENRVIMSACRASEIAAAEMDSPSPTVFDRFFCEALKKGYKTAESAFEYAREKTIEYVEKNRDKFYTHSHPQIYDSYPGNMVIAK